MEALSDAELREKCAAHGIKVGPLTTSTKKVYLRKLAAAIANQKKTNRQQNTTTPVAIKAQHEFQPPRTRQPKKVSLKF